MSERMIDHMSLNVADLTVMEAFYEKAFTPLGVKAMMRLGKEITGSVDVVGFGAEKPFFWLVGTRKTEPSQHIAFRAESRDEVDAFYKAALDAGGKDNGAPGLRPHYHENYYGAFVLDPEGHNVEAVCHKPGE